MSQTTTAQAEATGEAPAGEAPAAETGHTTEGTVDHGAKVFPPLDATTFPSQIFWLVIFFALLYLLLLLGRQEAHHAHRVLALDLVARMHHLVGELAGVGEQQQALGVEVEPPHRDPLGVAELGQLVEHRRPDEVAVGQFSIIRPRAAREEGRALRLAGLDEAHDPRELRRRHHRPQLVMGKPREAHRQRLGEGPRPAEPHPDLVAVRYGRMAVSPFTFYRGAALPMELRRGVAYDTELVAEVRRRLGDGVVDLRLASA